METKNRSLAEEPHGGTIPTTIRVMISVRSVQEARQAVVGGCDLLDLKEPRHGSLGPTSPTVWREVLAEVQSQVPGSGSGRPVTAALGELSDSPTLDRLIDEGLFATPKGGAPLTRLAYVKVGLAGLAAEPSSTIVSRLERLADRLPPGPGLIVALYADAERAGAPWPEFVLERLADRDHGRNRIAGVLLDTFDKASGSVLSLWSEPRLSSLRDSVQRLGWIWTLGGRLTIADGPAIGRLRPDVAAYRSAATGGDRDGPILAACVTRIGHSLRTNELPSSFVS